MWVYDIVEDYEQVLFTFKNEEDAIDALYAWCKTRGWEAYEYEGRHYGEFTSKRSGKKHEIEIRPTYIYDSFDEWVRKQSEYALDDILND